MAAQNKDEAGKISLGVELNGSSIGGQLSSIAKEALSLGKKAFAAVGIGMGTAAMKKFVSSCIDAGSDLAEVQNVVDNSFKTMSESVNVFAKNAMEQFGLSETVAKKYMGTIGAMNNAFGITEAESEKMAEAVAGLAGDVASFYNISSDEAFVKLKSIWTGETESLKDLGVVMSQTALDQYALNNGFGKTTANMTEQMKVMLRYQYVTDALSTAAGDFYRTQDGWANQTRVLTLRIESLKASLGQGFINLFTPILKCINTLVARLQVLADKFNEITALIMGRKDTGLSGVASSADDAASSVSEIGTSATDAAKKATKALASFDNLNNITISDSSTTDTGTSAGSMTTLGTVSTDDVIDDSGLASAIDDIKNRLKNLGMWLKNWGVNNFSGIFSKIFNDTRVQAQKFGETLATIWNDCSSLGAPLLEWLQGGFTTSLQAALLTISNIFLKYSDVLNTIFSSLWSTVVFPFLEKFVNEGLPFLSDVFVQTCSLLDTLFNDVKSVFDTVWNGAIVPALEVVTKIVLDVFDSINDAWHKYGEPIFEETKRALDETEKTFQALWNSTFKPICDNIISVITELWDEHLKPLLDNFLEFIAEVILAIEHIYTDGILPLVEEYGPAFAEGFNSMVEVLGKWFGDVSDIFNDVIDVAKDLIKFIVDVFNGEWEAAWNDIKDIFEDIWNGIYDVIKFVVNLVIDVINGMLNGIVSGVNGAIRMINGLSFKMPDWLGGYEFNLGLKELTVPQIPRLETGGIVDTPTLAMVGEHGQEAVMPLERNTGWIDKLATMINNKNSGGEEYLEYLMRIIELLEGILEKCGITDEDIIDVVMAEIRQHKKMTGRQPV